MGEAAHLDYLQGWKPSSRVDDGINERYLMPDSQQVSDAIRRAKLLPLDYQVVLMIPPVRRETDSGIYIASDSQAEREEQGAQIGIVVSIAENAFRTTASGCPMTIQPTLRDIVLFARYSGMIPMIPGLEPARNEAGRVDLTTGYSRLVKDEEILGIVGRVS